MKRIDFYFDFISPYAYLASSRVEMIARRHGRVVSWRPFRLGVTVVKVMGLKPLMETPLKGEYIARDLERLATVLSDQLSLSREFTDPIPPARLFYAAPAEHSGELAKALLRSKWADGRDIGNAEVLVEVAKEVGLDEELARRALADPATKASLDAVTSEAIARGVFGSPTCAVRKELFWGVDRLWLLDQYLGAGERYEPLEPPVRFLMGFA